MAAKKSSIPTPAQLREAFKTDLATCWQHARSLHPKETPYAFVLHGLEGTPHLYPYVHYVKHAAVVRVGEGQAVGGHAHNDGLRVTGELLAVGPQPRIAFTYSAKWNRSVPMRQSLPGFANA